MQKGVEVCVRVYFQMKCTSHQMSFSVHLHEALAKQIVMNMFDHPALSQSEIT